MFKEANYTGSLGYVRQDFQDTIDAIYSGMYIFSIHVPIYSAKGVGLTDYRCHFYCKSRENDHAED